MNSAQQKIQEYLSIFRQYKVEAEEIRNQITKSKVVKKRTPDVVSLIFDVPKSTVKDTLDLFPSKTEDPFSSWRNAFNREMQDLENFLLQCVILENDNTISRKKPKAYLSKTHGVSTPESKSKHVLDGVQKLKLLGKKLVYKDEIPIKEKIKKPEIQQKLSLTNKVAELWKRVLGNDINFVFSIDECEFFERKRESVSAKQTEELLVAMTNTYGGIIVYGVTDEKEPYPLDNTQRDDIQNQISNISRNNIKPKIAPEFKMIIQEEDKGYILIYIPKDEDILHTTNKDVYFKRVGSNNVIMTPDEIRRFYEERKNK